MARLLTSALLLALSSQLASAATTCGAGSLCPEDSPCCSQYGQCGVGAYCLGGCDPLYSFSDDSCVPAPVCQNRDVKFTNMDRLVENTKYLGDSSTADFVYSGEPEIYNNSVLLTMTESSVGTLLTSTTYMWYGKASAKLMTSGGQGVVTAFILLSDVKDEIDFEFVGYNLTQAQTNYYWQAVPNYDNGGNSSVPGGNSMTESHVYEFDWTPDTITWSIDGNVVRTKDKASTWNATTNQYNYPQTPARVELSIWPAGGAGNAPGTVAWSGGAINWNSPYMTNGYYYAAFEEVTIQCYSPPDGANATGNTSYTYSGTTGLNNTIAITDEKTVLKSFLGTGTNMSAGSAAVSSGSSSATTAATVPGLSGSGSGNSGGIGGESGSSASSSAASTGAASTGFVQGGGSSSTSGTAIVANERVLQGSLFAVLVAVVGMLVL